MTKRLSHKKARRADKSSGGDDMTLKGTISIVANITASNIGFDYHLVNTHSTTGIVRNHVNISDSFQLFRYKSLIMEWIPHVGPNSSDAAAIVKVNYITNPEDVFYISQTATATNADNFVKNTEGYKVFNAWERFQWRVPLSKYHRLPWYSVDTVYTASVEGYERNTQGLVVVTYQNTTTAAVILGEFRFHYIVEFKGLASTPGT